MKRLGRPHVAKMLEEQSLTLDDIFGSDGYSIEETGAYSAVLRTPLADFAFSDDPRDFVSAYIVGIPGIEVIQSPIDTWTHFFGEDPAAQKRSDSYRQQLANELNWIALIVDRILKDEATTRDAVWFVKGYNRAYNDWASGSWTAFDFNED